MITMINTIQENEIFNLADKVDYQDGASHPLVIDSNDRGEHVLMAVDKGVLIPEHKAPSDLIFQALEGEAVLHPGFPRYVTSHLTAFPQLSIFRSSQQRYNP